MLDRSAFPNSVWQITATATDDDGGSSTYSTALMVGTGGSESIQINDSTFASVGASRLIVMGMDGNDIIDGSQVRSGNNQLILDGGLGADYLFGGLGDDIYDLTSGTDFAKILMTSSLIQLQVNNVRGAEDKLVEALGFIKDVIKQPKPDSTPTDMNEVQQVLAAINQN